MQRSAVGQVELDNLSLDETIKRIFSVFDESRPFSFQVATVNAQFVQLARSDVRFADVLRSVDLSVADGVPLVWACRLLGHPIPGRVNGTDLMVRLCEEAARHSYKVYFLGGRPGAAEEASRRLGGPNSTLNVVGIDCPPMGFDQDPPLDAAVCSRIEQASPDLLFVGLGAPKQEYWIHNHRYLRAKVMVGVGGSFELVAGMTKRAPLFWQKSGLEWLWRLCMEPKRLWKRYLVGNTIFVFVVLRQYLAETFATFFPGTNAGKKGKLAK